MRGIKNDKAEACRFFLCLWQESNPHLSLRTGPLYPLSYRGNCGQYSNIKLMRGDKIYSIMESSNSPEIKDILAKQNELLVDNNRLLRKLYRYEVIGFWSKIFWIALLIGMPFALYYYVLEPYFSAFGSSYATFNAGVQELPGLKYFNEFLQQYHASSTTLE